MLFTCALFTDYYFSIADKIYPKNNINREA